MARLIVAVSGGIDSVVLLDMLSRLTDNELIVAHFDHGIRPDSAADADFVAALAGKYELPFASVREELGERASEELARRRRYAFLRELGKKHQAQIVTAHHCDDIVETVAINLTRGTGWRGLAVLHSDILRPLLHMTKAELKRYAKTRQLSWREDSTNENDAYLRNRLRKKTADVADDERRQLAALRRQQITLKQEIDREVDRLVGPGPTYSRYFFTHIPLPVAYECLRFVTNGTLTRPQMDRTLLAIKTAPAGSQYQAGSGVTLRLTTRNFSL